VNEVIRRVPTQPIKTQDCYCKDRTVLKATTVRKWLPQLRNEYASHFVLHAFNNNKKHRTIKTFENKTCFKLQQNIKMFFFHMYGFARVGCN